jgi:hypothetical protein
MGRPTWVSLRGEIRVAAGGAKGIGGFFPEAERPLGATRTEHPGLENVTGMAMSRAMALERLEGLTPRLEETFAKITQNPGLSSITHWSHEVSNWFDQMVALLPHVGKKTALTGQPRSSAGGKHSLPNYEKTYT